MKYSTFPPEIPDNAIFHVGVSGGKDSVAALLWMVHESGIPRERIVATFCDIGNDHECTIEHVALISRTVHPIETIKPETNFFDLALQKKRFPSPTARFCTEHLKIYPAQDHIQKLRRAGAYVVAVSGVRADESKEREMLPEWDYNGNLLCKSWRPLIRWTIKELIALHSKYAVPLNPLYALGASRVGCWPCVMSRKAEIRAIVLNFPERIDRIREEEQRHEKTNGQYNGFFHGNVVPKRFRSKPYKTADGRDIKIATIDDVARWSLTGKGAKGSWEYDPKEPISCQSGFCE